MEFGNVNDKDEANNNHSNEKYQCHQFIFLFFFFETLWIGIGKLEKSIYLI